MAPRKFTEALNESSRSIGLVSQVELALAKLEGDELDQVNAALRDRSLPGAQVARALKAWGFPVSAASVTSWRGNHL